MMIVVFIDQSIVSVEMSHLVNRHYGLVLSLVSASSDDQFKCEMSMMMALQINSTLGFSVYIEQLKCLSVHDDDETID